MTTLISTTDYTTFTGAVAPANFQELHDYVVASLEDVLGRWIVSKQYTEHIFPVYKSGVLFPRATPITASPVGWRYDDNCFYLVWDQPGGTDEPVNPDGFSNTGIDSGLGTEFSSDGLSSNNIDYFIEAGIDLTYTGGYTPYGLNTLYVPSGGDTSFQLCSDLPLALAKAIAWGINTKATPAAELAVPRGIQSMNVGGVISATIVPGTVLGADNWPVPRKLKAAQDLGGQCLTLAAKYRRLRRA